MKALKRRTCVAERRNQSEQYERMARQQKRKYDEMEVSGMGLSNSATVHGVFIAAPDPPSAFNPALLTLEACSPSALPLVYVSESAISYIHDHYTDKMRVRRPRPQANQACV